MPLTSIDGSSKSARDAPAPRAAVRPYAAAGTPPPIGLPIDEQVGVEPVRRRVPAGPGADRVGLVDHAATCRCSRVSRRSASWKPGSGSTMPMFVSAGSASTHATSPPASARRERVDVVERRPRPWSPPGRPAVRAIRGGARRGRRRRGRTQRLVDGAVVAPVEHEDLAPAGGVPGEAQGEAVGVRGAERELPRRQAEAPGQLAGDPRRVGRRQHRRDAPGRRRSATAAVTAGTRVAAHRPGVAEAQVDVLEAVDVREPPARAGRRTAGRHRASGASRPSARPPAGARRPRRPASPIAGGDAGSRPRSRAWSSARRDRRGSASAITGRRCRRSSLPRRTGPAVGAARRDGTGSDRTDRRRSARPGRRGLGDERLGLGQHVLRALGSTLVDDDGAARRRGVGAASTTSPARRPRRRGRRGTRRSASSSGPGTGAA